MQGGDDRERQDDVKKAEFLKNEEDEGEQKKGGKEDDDSSEDEEVRGKKGFGCVCVCRGGGVWGGEENRGNDISQVRKKAVC